MKKMRMLSMLLALLLVFSLSLSVLADDAAKITVESWTEAANAGDEVTLAVSIENNPGFLSAAWEIGYDSSKLALQSINTAYNVEIAAKTVEIPYLSGTYAPNPKENIVTFMNTTLVKDDSTIFTLTFLVKEGAAGEAAVSVTAKELFAENGKTVTAVSVPGGVTIAESTGGSTTGGSTTGGSTTGGSTTGGSTTGGSTTGGSTTGGSTTGGSTTGGSTTGGSTTGGSTTGGSTTGGSTTGGSTTGGSTTGGSTTGGSTTGGSTTGGSTTGGSTTGGSTTGGSTTGGSTTGGSTTGGSTTGGSTTGGSTTGGSTTGGSTTGGSTTGGSTTGGSTTGGSTTGGSTTGGSTTGGSTTGGSTTGSDCTVELVGKSNNATHTVTGNTLNVQNDVACVVLWTDDGGKTYTKLAATANEAGGYDFDLTNVPTNAVIKIAIKGDANGDGMVNSVDAGQAKAAALNKITFNALQTLIMDVDNTNVINSIDAAQVKAVSLNKLSLEW